MESGLGLGERVGRLTRRVKTGLARRRELRHELSVVQAAEARAERAPEEFRAVEIREAHMKLVRQYRPKPYDGAMVLFRCTGKSDKFEHTSELGWEGLVRNGVEVCEVTGTHLELFDEPHVHVLAHRLKQVLDRLPV